MRETRQDGMIPIASNGEAKRAAPTQQLGQTMMCNARVFTDNIECSIQHIMQHTKKVYTGLEQAPHVPPPHAFAGCKILSPGRVEVGDDAPRYSPVPEIVRSLLL